MEDPTLPGTTEDSYLPFPPWYQNVGSIDMPELKEGWEQINEWEG